MPTITPAEQGGKLPKDSTGKIAENVSLKNWRPSRKSVTAGAWVNLADGQPRSAIYIKNESTTDDLILAPVNDDTITHDPTNDNSGLLVGPGKSVEPRFTANLPVFARTRTGGGTIRVMVVESF